MRKTFAIFDGTRMARIGGILLVALVMVTPILPARAQESVVHAVIFYSPSCPHCHKVLQEDVPPLLEEHGEQLQIMIVDTTQPGGSELFHAAMSHFDVPNDQYYVPALVVGDTLLVGSGEIPAQFPGIVQQGLDAGGIDWPAIPEIREAIASQLGPEGEEEPEELATPGSSGTPGPDEVTDEPIPATEVGFEGGILGVWDRFALDPVANSVAVVILVGMLIVVGSVLFQWMSRSADTGPTALGWGVPVLCLIGIGVAGYLTYVETTQTLAVCGPVGDCNTVQQSSYARLFGVIPVGLFGLGGYVVILVASLFSIRFTGRKSAWATIAVFGFAFFGTLFSIYLTFLEPFVIGATCAWCLTSAVIITGLMWLTSEPARRAVEQI